MKRTTSASRRRTKRLAVCAMLAALGVVIVWFGALIDVLDLCAAALASMLTVIAVIAYGGAYPWGIYGATMLLSLLVLPQKTPALLYALFGYYPILKAYLERLPRRLTLLLKQVLFILLVAAAVVLSRVVVGLDTEQAAWYDWALGLVGFVTMNIFDVALTKLITLYVVRYAPRVSKWLK